MLVDLEIDGVPTKAAICSGKTGDVVAINAEEGHILWWTKVARHLNDQLQQLPFDHAIPVMPGSTGGVLTPPAFIDNEYYCVVTNRPTWHSATGPDFTKKDPWEGEIISLDATTGNVRWKVDLPTYPTGSVVVANDVVITAGLDGIVRAFLRSDGTQVWNYQLTAGVNAPVALAGDELYVCAGTPIQLNDAEAPESTFQIVKLKLGPGGGIVPDPVPDATVTDPLASDSAATPSSSPVTDEPAGDLPAATEGEAGFTFDLNMVDIAFEPNAFQIPADTDVIVTVTNSGVLQHDFVIQDQNVDSGMVPGGSAVEVTVNLPAGDYSYICTVEGHAAAGMMGTLTVY